MVVNLGLSHLSAPLMRLKFKEAVLFWHPVKYIISSFTYSVPFSNGQSIGGYLEASGELLKERDLK